MVYLIIVLIYAFVTCNTILKMRNGKQNGFKITKGKLVTNLSFGTIILLLGVTNLMV